MSQVNYENQSRINRNSKTHSRYIHRKREPVKPAASKADIYVTNKSNFKCNLERIEKLWNKGEPEIFVRALGAAIPRAINLCLQFQNEHHKVLDLEVSTNTVKITDHLEPLTDEDDFETLTRRNSSICIKLIRKIPISSSSE